MNSIATSESIVQHIRMVNRITNKKFIRMKEIPNNNNNALNYPEIFLEKKNVQPKENCSVRLR